jgi:uncharacterized protein involved in exopolysaccharide biosynthesis
MEERCRSVKGSFLPQESYNRPDDTPQKAVTSPETGESKVFFSDVKNILRAGKRTICYSALACLVVAAIGAFLTPNTYTASASFIAPAPQVSTMSLLSTQFSLGPASGGSIFKNPGDQQVSILLSRSVAQDMVSRFHLKDVYHTQKESLAEDALKSHTTTDVGVKDGIITVSVSDRDPKRAQDMANGYLDELRSANGRLALTESSQRRLFFEQQLVQEKDALANAEADLQKTQEQTGMIALAPQTSAEIQSIAATRADIESREVELSGLLQGSTEQDPAVVRLRSEINSLEGHLSQMMTGSGTTGVSAAKVPAMQLEYLRKQREVSYHETIFDILSRQYEAARLDESRDAPVLQILDPAVLPDRKSGPHRSLIMLIGLLVGAAGASFWLLRSRIASLITNTV